MMAVRECGRNGMVAINGVEHIDFLCKRSVLNSSLHEVGVVEDDQREKKILRSDERSREASTRAVFNLHRLEVLHIHMRTEYVSV